MIQLDQTMNGIDADSSLANGRLQNLAFILATNQATDGSERHERLRRDSLDVSRLFYDVVTATENPHHTIK